METSTSTNTAAITSLKDFVTHVKNATRDVGATDSLSRGGAENDLSGTAEADQLHFDPIMASLLSENQQAFSAFANWDASYVSAYSDDLKALDSMGNLIQYRMNHCA